MRTKHRLAVAIVGAMFLALAACAASEPSSGPSTPDGGDHSVVVAPPPAPEDASVDGDGKDTATNDAGLACSDAGWCQTAVPPGTLSFIEIAPLESAAFALAWLDGITTPLFFDGGRWTVLAFDRWSISPKGKQVLYSIAAASHSEVWVGGVDGFLARGQRDGAGVFSWTVQDIGTNETVRSIWVNGSSDVFVTAGARLYRSSANAGMWTVDYDETDDPSSLVLEAVVGRDAHDMWLAGTRAHVPYGMACAYAMHRDANGWARVYDVVVDEWSGCIPKDSYLYSPLKLLRPEASGPAQLTAIMKDTGTIVRVTLDAANVPIATDQVPIDFDTQAIWTEPSTSDVLTASFGIVRRGRSIWDGGAWEISSVAFGPTPTLKWFRALGGTGPQNMWVVGESHALHKTNAN